MKLDFTQPPGILLLHTVQAGFTLRGTSLTTWGKQYGYHPNYLRNVLCGSTNGKNAQSLRKKIIADLQKLEKETSQ